MDIQHRNIIKARSALGEYMIHSWTDFKALVEQVKTVTLYMDGQTGAKGGMANIVDVVPEDFVRFPNVEYAPVCAKVRVSVWPDHEGIVSRVGGWKGQPAREDEEGRDAMEIAA